MKPKMIPNEMNPQIEKITQNDVAEASSKMVLEKYADLVISRCLLLLENMQKHI